MTKLFGGEFLAAHGENGGGAAVTSVDGEVPDKYWCTKK